MDLETLLPQAMPTGETLTWRWEGRWLDIASQRTTEQYTARFPIPLSTLFADPTKFPMALILQQTIHQYTQDDFTVNWEQPQFQWHADGNPDQWSLYLKGNLVVCRSDARMEISFHSQSGHTTEATMASFHAGKAPTTLYGRHPISGGRGQKARATTEATRLWDSIPNFQPHINTIEVLVETRAGRGGTRPNTARWTYPMRSL